MLHLAKYLAPQRTLSILKARLQCSAQLCAHFMAKSGKWKSIIWLQLKYLHLLRIKAQLKNSLQVSQWGWNPFSHFFVLSFLDKVRNWLLFAAATALYPATLICVTLVVWVSLGFTLTHRHTLTQKRKFRSKLLRLLCAKSAFSLKWIGCRKKRNEKTWWVRFDKLICGMCVSKKKRSSDINRKNWKSGIHNSACDADTHMNQRKTKKKTKRKAVVTLVARFWIQRTNDGTTAASLETRKWINSCICVSAATSRRIARRNDPETLSKRAHEFIPKKHSTSA